MFNFLQAMFKGAAIFLTEVNKLSRISKLSRYKKNNSKGKFGLLNPDFLFPFFKIKENFFN
ncbi:hypothetical protein BpHYR1_035589 [Brachionus plicatilis]|uniref:Uncharacterized protein n=1 Tax=Brachionus plicatilis TaxID=10195 RepID=A0A3M7R9Q9_BRAPC|nr:hypothetical protein BpHYR1_035589 [Brachionus plicatilis]